LIKKTTIYLYLGLHKGRPSYKRLLQLSKVQIRIPNTDSDSLTWLNPDPIRIQNPVNGMYSIIPRCTEGSEEKGPLISSVYIISRCTEVQKKNSKSPSCLHRIFPPQPQSGTSATLPAKNRIILIIFYSIFHHYGLSKDLALICRSSIIQRT